MMQKSLSDCTESEYSKSAVNNSKDHSVWKIVNLNDIVHINKSSINPKKEFFDDEFTYIDIKSIENGTGKINDIKKLKGHEAPSRARRLIYADDILMSTVRPYLKGFCIIPPEHDKHICSTGFAVLRAKEHIYPKFVFYSLFSDFIIDQCKKMMIGASYPALNMTQVKNIKIQVPFDGENPDLTKQKLIAEKIEIIFKSITKNEKLRHNSLEKTNKLYDTILNKIFEDSEKNDDFRWVKIEDSINKKSKFKLGKLKSEEYFDQGTYPIIDQGKEFIVGFNNNESLLYNGKLPVVLMGDHTLNIKYVDFRFIQGADGLKILIPKDKILARYLYHMIKFVRPNVKKYSRHYKIIKDLLIPLPFKNNQIDTEKQFDIVNYLDELEKKIKQLENFQDIQLQKFTHLRESILNKAFKGQL
jgi:hypothetical protein